MAKLILTRGVPASGKSTWAKQWVTEGPRRARLNRDSYRAHHFFAEGVLPFEMEQIITDAQQADARRFLRLGYDVVIDDTNLRAKFVKEWMWLASDENVDAEFKDFYIDYQTAIGRDSNRDKRVGEAVIKSYFARFVQKDKLPDLPKIEGRQLPQTGFARHEFTPGLPKAIIVDIDGTIAHMQGRSPYDDTLYGTDTYDEVVADIAHSWAERTQYSEPYPRQLILMSGRNETGRDTTLEWLDRHGFWYDQFFMRAADDNRNDAIVKNELFETHVAGKFNVEFVLDDRNQVVKMWRAKGLKVLQVAEGDF